MGLLGLLETESVGTKTPEEVVGFSRDHRSPSVYTIVLGTWTSGFHSKFRRKTTLDGGSPDEKGEGRSRDRVAVTGGGNKVFS